MMIIRRKWVFLAVAAMLAISCKQPDENTIEFEELTLNKTVALTNDEDSPKCSISLKLLQATEANGHKAEVINNTVVENLFHMHDMSITGAMERFTDNYASTYKQTMLPLYKQDRNDSTKRAWYEYHYVISAEASQGNKQTVVYQATIDYYEGGARGTHLMRVMNFEAKTGRLLTLEDLFADGTENQLNNILLKALKEKTGYATLSELKEHNYLTSVDIYAPKNFIIGDETVTFIYNPSEIAAYSEGSIELIIPYTSLDKLLKNSFTY